MAGNKDRKDMMTSQGSQSLKGGHYNYTRSMKNVHSDTKQCKPVYDEMEGCTFQPKINRYVPVKSHYE